MSRGGSAPDGASRADLGKQECAEIKRIKARHYECFFEDHESKPWTPGQCAGYAGRGSLGVHLMRCKRKSGHGLGGLFCRQHARIEVSHD